MGWAGRGVAVVTSNWDGYLGTYLSTDASMVGTHRQSINQPQFSSIITTSIDLVLSATASLLLSGFQIGLLGTTSIRCTPVAAEPLIPSLGYSCVGVQPRYPAFAVTITGLSLIVTWFSTRSWRRTNTMHQVTALAGKGRVCVMAWNGLKLYYGAVAAPPIAGLSSHGSQPASLALSLLDLHSRYHTYIIDASSR